MPREIEANEVGRRRARIKKSRMFEENDQERVETAGIGGLNAVGLRCECRDDENEAQRWDCVMMKNGRTKRLVESVPFSYSSYDLCPFVASTPSAKFLAIYS